jgi:DNA-binding beta-propeller fold protein YncE
VPLLRRVVTTYAGTGAESQKDGLLLSATFADVRVITADPDRKSFFVTDKNEIRELTKDGSVVTVAGSAARGTEDGTGSADRFYDPSGIAYDPVDKALYICDTKNFTIRRMTTDGVVTTLAGSPLEGRRDGTGPDAGFSHPGGIAYDARDGALYVADTNNNEIRRVTTAGVVTTIAGGREGFADGTGSNARFSSPDGIAYNAADGDFYVTDPGNERIRRVTPDGITTTVTGGSNASFIGPKAMSRWGVPIGIAWDPVDGSLYVADFLFSTIRRISPQGVVSNIAGNGSTGRYDGVFEGAEFDRPIGIAADPVTGYLYVADFGNNLIRLIQ